MYLYNLGDNMEYVQIIPPIAGYDQGEVCG